MNTCGCMTVPCGTATWPVMLLSNVDDVSRIYLLCFVLGNDVAVWPSPWYYYLYLADYAIVHCWLRFTYIYLTFCFRKRCICVAVWPYPMVLLPGWWCCSWRFTDISFTFYFRKQCVHVAVWPYPHADDATYGPLLMAFHIHIFYVLF